MRDTPWLDARAEHGETAERFSAERPAYLLTAPQFIERTQAIEKRLTKAERNLPATNFRIVLQNSFEVGGLPPYS